FFSSRRRHTRFSRDWSSDVCSSDLVEVVLKPSAAGRGEEICRRLRATGLEIASESEGKVKGTIPADRVGEIERMNGVARVDVLRSEERRVGKECRSRWSADD